MGAKVYFVSGHGAGDSGAVGCGREEAQMVRMLAQRIYDLAPEGTVALMPFERNCYADDGILKYAIPAGAEVCSLHMDSAVEGARGGHVIIKDGFEPDAVDLALASLMEDIFPGRAESLRKVSWLKNANQAAITRRPYRLVENGFISNPDDVRVFEERIDDIARGYLAAFGIEGGEKPKPEPTPVLEPQAVPNSTEEFHGGLYRAIVDEVCVYTGPGLGYDVVAKYKMGGEVWLDDWYAVHDGIVWARYTGIASGKLRYIPVGPHTGAPDAGDYLVLV